MPTRNSAQYSSNHFTDNAPAANTETLCAFCQEPASTDLTIRCHLCHTTHHLDCYSNNDGCAVFGCLTIKAIHISNQSEESLAENVFRAELQQSVNRWSTRDDSSLALLMICLTGAIFFVLYLIF